MARVLVGYIPCDRRVRSAILSEFISAPGLSKIASIRKARQDERDRFAREKTAADYDRRGWDWRGENHRLDMEVTSGIFVDAIARERDAAAIGGRP